MLRSEKVSKSYGRLLTCRHGVVRERADIAKRGNDRASSPPPPFESWTRVLRAHHLFIVYAHHISHVLRMHTIYTCITAPISVRIASWIGRRRRRWRRRRQRRQRRRWPGEIRVYDSLGTARQMNCGPMNVLVHSTRPQRREHALSWGSSWATRGLSIKSLHEFQVQIAMAF